MSPRAYRPVVEGEPGPRYASASDGMTFSAHDGETKIIGSMIDPALLQSLFEQIAGLGLMLWRVVPLENQPMEEP